MLPVIVRPRSVLRVLALLIYLSFPVLMGFNHGFINGFLPSLLWPVPVFLAIFFIGSIPFWAVSFGDLWFVLIWIAQAAVVVAIGKRSGAGRWRVIGGTWTIIAVINFLLWIALGPESTRSP